MYLYLFIISVIINLTLLYFLKNKINENQKLIISEEKYKMKEEMNQFQLETLNDMKEEMTLKFKVLSEEILEKQAEKSLSTIINPFKEDLSDFKNKVNLFYQSDLEDRTLLRQELISLKEFNKDISEETRNLTSALKGDNKIMGNWGELILEKVLEFSGLRKDKEYFREVTFKNKKNELFRPDVLIKLPNERDVIIDSKTSLIDYERYVSTGEEQYLKNHINSIEKHIKGLSSKNYNQLEGINSLDFVFLFIPIESSLSLALEKKPSLFEFAYSNNVFLVSPTSLLIGLRTIENMWSYKKQEENVKKIVEKAGSLYDKFAGFVTDIDKLSDQMNTANKTLDSAKNKLYTGNGNLIKKVNELKEMGVNSSKKIL